MWEGGGGNDGSEWWADGGWRIWSIRSLVDAVLGLNAPRRTSVGDHLLQGDKSSDPIIQEPIVQLLSALMSFALTP
jgi:hypothetical protein